jgi:hypothetical protein
MTDQGYLALCAMINMARFDQIKCVSTLKRVMTQRGYQPEHIAEALGAWAKHEWGKRI